MSLWSTTGSKTATGKAVSFASTCCTSSGVQYWTVGYNYSFAIIFGNALLWSKTFSLSSLKSLILQKIAFSSHIGWPISRLSRKAHSLSESVAFPASLIIKLGLVDTWPFLFVYMPMKILLVWFCLWSYPIKRTKPGGRSSGYSGMFLESWHHWKIMAVHGLMMLQWAFCYCSFLPLMMMGFCLQLVWY